MIPGKKAAIEEREKLSAELTELQERQKELGIYKDQQAKKREVPGSACKNGTETADFKKKRKAILTA